MAVNLKSNLLIDDPIIRRVICTWKLSPVLTWVISSAVPLLFFGLLSVILGEFRSHDGVIGFINSYGFISNCLIGIPLAFTFYCYSPIYLQECFEQLAENGVYGAARPKRGDETWESFLRQIRKSFKRPIWAWASFIISAVFIGSAIPIHLRGNDWVQKHVISVVFSELMWIIFIGMTLLFVLRVVIGIWWINQSFHRFEINVRPLYPDGVGGLMPLSQFSLRLGYIIFFVGIELGLNQYMTGYQQTGSFGFMPWTADILLGWGVYLLLAPIAFFAPISSAHDAMRDAKKHELNRIARQFDRDYDILRDRLDQDTQTIEPRFKKIEELRKLYEMVKSFPIWPFQFEKLVQFVLTIITPILLTLVSTVLTYWVEKFLK